jgi:hypothetical protein
MLIDAIPAAVPPPPRPAVADTQYMVIHWYALGATACCAALFLWWVLFQHVHRCAECGSAPVLCRCATADG